MHLSFMTKHKKDGVFPFKDKRGEWRLRVIVSGRVTYSSTEGYKNKKDMLNAAKESAKRILEYFEPFFE